MIPGSCRFVSACSSVEYNGLAEGEGGVLKDLRVSSDVARWLGDREQALQVGVDLLSGLGVRQVSSYGSDGVAPLAQVPGDCLLPFQQVLVV